MVLCLNETKIDEQALEKDGVKQQLSSWFPIEGQYWNCCKAKKGYAGTAVLIHREFKEEYPKITYDIGLREHDQEGRVVTAEFEKFMLVATYVPNAGCQGLNRLGYRVNEWDRDFHGYCKNLEALKNKPVVVAGDLNVALNEMDVYGAKGKAKCAGFTKEERASFGKHMEED
jgi:AP endonuclease-1